MQIFHLHRKILGLYAHTIPEKRKSEYEKLCEETVWKWEKLKKNKVRDKEIQTILGISRATYYRRKKFLECPIYKSKKPLNARVSRFKEDIYNLILKIRRENPTYGKLKITVILRRDYDVQISESSVGRIMKKLLLPKSASASRFRRKRKFNKHAKPWKFKEYKGMEVGENVQIDHMTVNKNGVALKHFAAWERKTKYLYANVYLKADSKIAEKFLRELIDAAPYKIRSIQVDGGSEFMKHFEDACSENGIPLVVLPPSKPKYNGGVERSNRTLREEFYDSSKESSICAFRRELMKYLDRYNNFRPHFALKGLTPFEYNSLILETSPLSHIL